MAQTACRTGGEDGGVLTPGAARTSAAGTTGARAVPVPSHPAAEVTGLGALLLFDRRPVRAVAPVRTGRPGAGHR
jgi:hypothetical protein